MDGTHASARRLPARHRFTLNEAIAMTEAGILPEGRRIELIDGALIDMAPIGPEHSEVVTDLGFALTLACGKNGKVRVQQPLRLGPEDAPEPDFAVVRSQSYGKRHPGPEDTFLVIEVANTSLDYDRRVKLELYASAGVPEYWIIDLKAGVLSAYRNPARGRYAEPTTHKPGERLTLAAAQDITVALDLVFTHP